MEQQPQLIMRLDRLEDLPPLSLSRGDTLHTHQTGLERAWEEIIESAFGFHMDFDFLKRVGAYAPEYVLYIRRGDEEMATTTATENPQFPGEGWLRMVGVKSEAKGLGLGKAIILAALYALRARGYHSVLLSTDDGRTAALCAYLSLGFRPVYLHESHHARWEALKDILPPRFASLI